ncbi:hypothetical protein SBRCBS47491_009244 [Sporothrix bragantina]|uniref:Major facilitator superfamily (MFS) profile domain-containing protein n=1 Tax=Sporothrix bragantina TaxID=671064 RepID=A0ABP0CT41_9PEZI
MSGKDEEHQVEQAFAPEIESLSSEHRDYLIERHGTCELEPVPSMSTLDPLNWSKSKKIMNLALVAFHAMMATFTAASIQSAFVNIAADLDIGMNQVSYLVSLVIAVLGGAPLFWRPIAKAYGCRPVFLISLFCSMICNIGCGLSHSYAAMCATRALVAFFISPAASIGSGVVSDMFFKHQRGRYMGAWTTMVTLGVPIAPFIFGFAVDRVGYRWIYWTLAITNFVQFVLYFFFGAETRYLGAALAEEKTRGYFGRLLHFRRIDPTPIRVIDFISPLLMGRHLCILFPAISYAMVFLWASVMTSIEIPQVFPERYGFNSQQVGYQFAGIIIGTLLGEQIGGFMSDKWMWLARQRKGGHTDAQPEFRLWISYIGHGLTICGVVVFLVQIAAIGNHWNITPIIGAAIAAAGNQIVTTVMITYAVDCYRAEAAGVGVFIIFVRQMWGFIGPFWFPELIEKVGMREAAAVASCMMVGVSIVPTMLLQWKGRSWRS